MRKTSNSDSSHSNSSLNTDSSSLIELIRKLFLLKSAEKDEMELISDLILKKGSLGNASTQHSDSVLSHDSSSTHNSKNSAHQETEIIKKNRCSGFTIQNDIGSMNEKLSLNKFNLDSCISCNSICLFCDKKFVIKKCLINHIQLKHLDIYLYCAYCSSDEKKIVFPSKKHLMTHLQTYHRIHSVQVRNLTRNQSFQKNEPDPKNFFKNKSKSVLSKVFQNHAVLSTSNRSCQDSNKDRLNSKNLPCKQSCNNSFPQNSARNTNSVTTEKESKKGKNSKCPLCDKDVDHLAHHIKNAHSNVKHLKCTFCKPTTFFLKNAHLQEHISKMHSSKPTTSSDQCQKNCEKNCTCPSCCFEGILKELFHSVKNLEKSSSTAPTATRMNEVVYTENDSQIFRDSIKNSDINIVTSPVPSNISNSLTEGVDSAKNSSVKNSDIDIVTSPVHSNISNSLTEGVDSAKNNFQSSYSDALENLSPSELSKKHLSEVSTVLKNGENVSEEEVNFDFMYQHIQHIEAKNLFGVSPQDRYFKKHKRKPLNVQKKLSESSGDFNVFVRRFKPTDGEHPKSFNESSNGGLFKQNFEKKIIGDGKNAINKATFVQTASTKTYKHEIETSVLKSADGTKLPENCGMSTMPLNADGIVEKVELNASVCEKVFAKAPLFFESNKLTFLKEVLNLLQSNHKNILSGEEACLTNFKNIEIIQKLINKGRSENNFEVLQLLTRLIDLNKYDEFTLNPEVSQKKISSEEEVLENSQKQSSHNSYEYSDGEKVPIQCTETIETPATARTGNSKVGTTNHSAQEIFQNNISGNQPTLLSIFDLNSTNYRETKSCNQFQSSVVEERSMDSTFVGENKSKLKKLGAKVENLNANLSFTDKNLGQKHSENNSKHSDKLNNAGSCNFHVELDHNKLENALKSKHNGLINSVYKAAALHTNVNHSIKNHSGFSKLKKSSKQHPVSFRLSEKYSNERTSTKKNVNFSCSTSLIKSRKATRHKSDFHKKHFHTHKTSINKDGKQNMSSSTIIDNPIGNGECNFKSLKIKECELEEGELAIIFEKKKTVNKTDSQKSSVKSINHVRKTNFHPKISKVVNTNSSKICNITLDETIDRKVSNQKLNESLKHCEKNNYLEKGAALPKYSQKPVKTVIIEDDCCNDVHDGNLNPNAVNPRKNVFESLFKSSVVLRKEQISDSMESSEETDCVKCELIEIKTVKDECFDKNDNGTPTSSTLLEHKNSFLESSLKSPSLLHEDQLLNKIKNPKTFDGNECKKLEKKTHKTCIHKAQKSKLPFLDENCKGSLPKKMKSLTQQQEKCVVRKQSQNIPSNEPIYTFKSFEPFSKPIHETEAQKNLQDSYFIDNEKSSKDFQESKSSDVQPEINAHDMLFKDKTYKIQYKSNSKIYNKQISLHSNVNIHWHQAQKLDRPTLKSDENFSKNFPTSKTRDFTGSLNLCKDAIHRTKSDKSCCVEEYNSVKSDSDNKSSSIRGEFDVSSVKRTKNSSKRNTHPLRSTLKDKIKKIQDRLKSKAYYQAMKQHRRNTYTWYNPQIKNCSNSKSSANYHTEEKTGSSRNNNKQKESVTKNVGQKNQNVNFNSCSVKNEENSEAVKNLDQLCNTVVKGNHFELQNSTCEKISQSASPPEVADIVIKSCIVSLQSIDSLLENVKIGTLGQILTKKSTPLDSWDFKRSNTSSFGCSAKLINSETELESSLQTKIFEPSENFIDNKNLIIKTEMTPLEDVKPVPGVLTEDSKTSFTEKFNCASAQRNQIEPRLSVLCDLTDTLTNQTPQELFQPTDNFCLHKQQTFNHVESAKTSITTDANIKHQFKGSQAVHKMNSVKSKEFTNCSKGNIQGSPKRDSSNCQIKKIEPLEHPLLKSSVQAESENEAEQLKQVLKNEECKLENRFKVEEDLSVKDNHSKFKTSRTDKEKRTESFSKSKAFIDSLATDSEIGIDAISPKAKKTFSPFSKHLTQSRDSCFTHQRRFSRNIKGFGFHEEHYSRNQNHHFRMKHNKHSSNQLIYDSKYNSDNISHHFSDNSCNSKGYSSHQSYLINSLSFENNFGLNRNSFTNTNVLKIKRPSGVIYGKNPKIKPNSFNNHQNIDNCYWF